MADTALCLETGITVEIRGGPPIKKEKFWEANFSFFLKNPQGPPALRGHKSLNILSGWKTPLNSTAPKK